MKGRTAKLPIPGPRQPASPAEKPDYYPAFIDLRSRECVVIGGGKVAERKALSLLSCGAVLKVISPEFTGLLEREATKGNIRLIRRAYKKGDLKNAFLVIAATSDTAINRKVSEDAACLVNVVDMPGMANFIVPATVRRGPLTIAVSSSGASPAVVKAIRIELEALYGKDFGRFLSFLSVLRKKVIRDITDKKTREGFLKKVASGKMFDVLRKKGFKEARELVMKELQNAKH